MKFIPMLFDMGINSIITGYATAPIFSLELRKTSAQQSTYLIPLSKIRLWRSQSMVVPSGDLQ